MSPRTQSETLADYDFYDDPYDAGHSFLICTSAAKYSNAADLRNGFNSVVEQGVSGVRAMSVARSRLDELLPHRRRPTGITH